LIGCPLYVTGVRTTAVEPPKRFEGVTARHFVEVISWSHDRAPDSPGGYVLTWRPYELQGNSFIPRAEVELRRVPAWPHSPAVPEAETRVTLEMDHSGRVRWHFEGAVSKRGWLANPE
jgi:hypothetical protein